jgi:autotransporter-associated beta strand protein
LSPSSTISIASGATLRFDHTSGADFVQGTDFSSSAITGAGQIIKEGTCSLTFNVANTFSGGLTINKGTVVSAVDGALGTGNVSLTAGNITLTLSGASNNIADSATLSYVNTDVINLNNTTTDTVAGLIVDGVAQAAGVYGASAINPDGAFFGVGTITVVPEPTTVGMVLLGASLLAGVQRFRRRQG